MTSASERRLLACLLSLGASSCFEEIYKIPDSELGVNAALRGVQNRAPMVASFAMDLARLECRVDHWGDLHPDQPERMWAPLTRREIVEIDSLHESISDHAGARFVFGPFDEVQLVGDTPSLVAVAPWAGTADIECGGEPITDALVIVLWLMGQGSTDHGTTDAEALAAASANVEREGLAGVTDLDLTVRNECYYHPEEGADCTAAEPRPLTGT